MPGESTGVGTLAVAAPVIAIVGAAFMGCCTLAAISFTASSAYDTATILLIAGLPAFGLSQAVALAFGIVAFANCIRGKAVGLPEAITGAAGTTDSAGWRIQLDINHPDTSLHPGLPDINTGKPKDTNEALTEKAWRYIAILSRPYVSSRETGFRSIPPTCWK